MRRVARAEPPEVHTSSAVAIAWDAHADGESAGAALRIWTQKDRRRQTAEGPSLVDLTVATSDSGGVSSSASKGYCMGWCFLGVGVLPNLGACDHKRCPNGISELPGTTVVAVDVSVLLAKHSCRGGRMGISAPGGGHVWLALAG